MDLKTLLRKIELKKQFIQILEEEAKEVDRACTPEEAAVQSRPST